MKRGKISYSRYIQLGLCGSCPSRVFCEHEDGEECVYVLCSMKDFHKYAPYVLRREFVFWIREQASALGVSSLTALRAFRKSYRTVSRMVAICN